jgi:hypothetical protein
LNKNVKIIINEAKDINNEDGCVNKKYLIDKKSNVPTSENIKVIPYNNSPLEIAPNEKYLIEASIAIYLLCTIFATIYNTKLKPSIDK